MVEVTDEAFDYKMLKRATLILNNDKFVCDEAQKVHDWYEGQKSKFQDVKAQVDQFKLEGTKITWFVNRELTAALPAFVDFGRKEQALLQDLWHSKMDQLLAGINRP